MYLNNLIIFVISITCSFLAASDIHENQKLPNEILSHVLQYYYDPDLRLVNHFFKDTICIHLNRPITLSWEIRDAVCALNRGAFVGYNLKKIKAGQQKALWFIKMSAKEKIKMHNWWILKRCPEDSFILFLSAVAKQKELNLELNNEYLFQGLCKNSLPYVSDFLIDTNMVQVLRLKCLRIDKWDIENLKEGILKSKTLKTLEFYGSSILDTAGMGYISADNIELLEDIATEAKSLESMSIHIEDFHTTIILAPSALKSGVEEYKNILSVEQCMFRNRQRLQEQGFEWEW